MHPINPYHVALAAPLLQGCMALMCWMVWSSYRRHQYLLWMAANQVLLATAITLQTLLRADHPHISALWPTVLYLGSALCLNITMHKRLGQSPPIAPLLLLASAFTGLMAVFIYASPHIVARITTLSWGMGAIALYGAHRLLRAPKRHKLDRFALWAYCAGGLFALLRPLLMLGFGTEDLAAQRGMMWSIALLAMVLLSLALCVSLSGSAMLDTVHVLRDERNHDSLTGLLNRRALHESCGPEPASRGVQVMALCDLDHFKRINDVHGHAVGDDVLRNFALLLRSNLREGDAVARLGGEEFAIALRSRSIRDALTALHRIRLAMRHVHWSERTNRPLQVTASWGVVLVEPHESLEDTLERADAQLYEAKRAGRDCICCTEVHV